MLKSCPWTEVWVVKAMFTNHTALYCCKSRRTSFVFLAVDPLPSAASLGEPKEVATRLAVF